MLKGGKPKRTRALKIGERRASTFHDKEEVFADTILGKEPTYEKKFPLPDIEEEKRVKVSVEEAAEAIFSQDSFKAPGSDRIQFKILKEAWG